MATASAAASEMCIVIPNIAWEIFESLAASDCAGTRFAYDDGMLEIVSPCFEHEWFHRLLGRTVEAMTEELNIAIRSCWFHHVEAAIQAARFGAGRVLLPGQ